MKKCFKCGEVKSLTEYYKHKQMKDGHLNKCKECTKADSVNQFNINKNNEEWLESERSRHRDKYHRLEYKDKHKPTPEQKIKNMNAYRSKFPEKYKARCASQHIETPNGFHRHHWSYLESHFKDVIFLTIKDHNKAHRFLVYDQERCMYRRNDNMELLDTKELHVEFINDKIKNEQN